jgi:UDP-galactopyranose mutase
LVNDKSILHKYINEAKSLKNISFLGRLGTYRYIDMDVTIGEALSASEEIAVRIKNKQMESFVLVILYKYINLILIGFLNIVFTPT